MRQVAGMVLGMMLLAILLSVLIGAWDVGAVTKAGGIGRTLPVAAQPDQELASQPLVTRSPPVQPPRSGIDLRITPTVQMSHSVFNTPTFIVYHEQLAVTETGCAMLWAEPTVQPTFAVDVNATAFAVSVERHRRAPSQPAALDSDFDQSLQSSLIIIFGVMVFFVFATVGRRWLRSALLL